MTTENHAIGNPAFASRPKRLLLVDDAAPDRALIAGVLQASHQPEVELVSVWSVDSALRAMGAQNIDLVLTDYTLGRGETGQTLYRAARNQSHQMPFICITGHGDEERIAQQLLTVGFDDVVAKKALGSANIHKLVRNACLRSEHERRLLELQSEDELTGVLNPRGLLLRLELECARAQQHQQALSLLCVDIKGFRDFNEVRGYAAADSALMQVADLLTSLTQNTDAVGRLGGDVFLVILPNATMQVALDLAARITAALREEPLGVLSQRMALRVQFGTSSLPAGAKSPGAQTLIRQAREELLEVKRKRS